MTPPRPVAVTGLGLMTGLGLDLASSWEGLLAGRSPIRPFSLFDPGDLAAGFGVQLPPEADELFERRIKKRRRGQMTRGTMIALCAADMALHDAGLPASDERVDRSRIGVVVGTTGTGYAWQGPGPDEQRILRNMSNSPASWISLEHRFTGPAFTVSTACSSGVYALAAAASLIQSGLCDAVVAGAADSSLNYPDVQGFAALMALSEDREALESASRPFDRRRSGFVMGEGGGFLLLERPEHARRRGATVLCEMPLPALVSEAYNIISPQPGGVGMARCMSLALTQAGMEPHRIQYINAHGTSTSLNDRYETQAIRDVFGPHARHLAISSTKSMTGHCLAGAAGVEAVICVKALGEGVIPPTANLTEPDPELDLDYVPLLPRPARLSAVMCNSFAFGGHNGVCIFQRPEPWS